MKRHKRVPIGRLPSGVPGLDVVLGGGILEYSLNIVAGGPGTGKTTLVQQIIFANASPERRAIVLTALGEAPLKMLRYQQQFSFFDIAKVDDAVRFVNLSEEALGSDVDTLLETVVREIESVSAGLVVIDSFRTMMRAGGIEDRGGAGVERFIHRLSTALMSLQATIFLVGEYVEEEIMRSQVFTMVDGILWHQHTVERNSTVRKLQVVKVRGQSPLPGLHTFRISENGVEVYPRLPVPTHAITRVSSDRVSSGVPGLDEMLHGGFFVGDSILVTGPAGTGKTVLSTQFIADGVRRGERGIIAVFEEQPDRYQERAERLGFPLSAMVEAKRLQILYLRSVDLSVDETLHAIQATVEQLGAKRLVIDSLTGFELAVAPAYRDEFREAFYRMIGRLSSSGITVLMTVEVVESFTNISFSPHAISFLTDDLVLQRYVEIEGTLQRMIAVVKMRGSDHDHALRRFEITSTGLVVGESLSGYRGLLTGIPGKLTSEKEALYTGLSEIEVRVQEALNEQREASAAKLAALTGLDRRALRLALDRLLALNYAIQGRSGGRTVYRPAVQTLRR